VIKQIRPAATAPAGNVEWLNLADTVQVELTSEDPDWPIEGALLLDDTKGWRAGTPGPQSISLVWSDPIRIGRIRLVFEERTQMRTHEFVLRAWTGEGEREIVRQQFTFAPPGTTVEREEYATSLDGVTRLQLAIVPAIDNVDAIATITQWRVA
jgi:hypothetical protein